MGKGEAPAGVRGFVSYGSNLRAMVSYFNTEQHIPYKRLKELLNDVFNLTQSQGTICNILNRVKNTSADIYEAICRRVESSGVVGADETGARISGKLHWFWAFQTDKPTYVYPDQSRGKVGIDKHFPEGLPHSLLVTDRHSSYFNMKTKGHQICLAHLLRELTYLEELEPGEAWSREMKKLLQGSIHKRKTQQWKHIDRKEIFKRFKNLLFQCLQTTNDQIKALQKSLIKHGDQVFRFLFDPNVPYDNNVSERSIRPLKLKQKVSGTFRSHNGAHAYAVIHSIADTARKKWKLTLIGSEIYYSIIIRDLSSYTKADD